MRGVLALLAALTGAGAGAAGLRFLLASIFVAMYGTFEGSAAMGGFGIGMPMGSVLGGCVWVYA